MSQIEARQSDFVWFAILFLLQKPENDLLPYLRAPAVMPCFGYFSVAVSNSPFRHEAAHLPGVFDRHAATYGSIPLAVDHPHRRVLEVLYQQGSRAPLPGGFLPGMHVEGKPARFFP